MKILPCLPPLIDEGKEVKKAGKSFPSRQDERLVLLGGTSGEQTGITTGGGTVDRGALSHQTHPLLILKRFLAARFENQEQG